MDEAPDERRKRSLSEWMDAIEQECRRGHRDLRKAVSELEAQADAFEHDLKALTEIVERAASAPVESTRVRFSTAVVVSIVVLTASVVGAGWKVTSKIDALDTNMTRQSEDDKRERASLAKLYDERNTRTLTVLDSLTRQQKLTEYEIQRLREDMKGQKR